jgi:hypothetical protein
VVGVVVLVDVVLVDVVLVETVVVLGRIVVVAELLPAAADKVRALTTSNDMSAMAPHIAPTRRRRAEFTSDSGCAPHADEPLPTTAKAASFPRHRKYRQVVGGP